MKNAAALLLVLVAACRADDGPAPAAQGADGAAAGATRGMPVIERLTESFEGTAVEVLQARGYTYVAVETEGDSDGARGVRWAVSLQKTIDPGARVRVRAFGKKNAFVSKQLGRTFDELWFAIVTPVTRGEAT